MNRWFYLLLIAILEGGSKVAILYAVVVKNRPAQLYLLAAGLLGWFASSIFRGHFISGKRFFYYIDERFHRRKE